MPGTDAVSPSRTPRYPSFSSPLSSPASPSLGPVETRRTYLPAAALLAAIDTHEIPFLSVR